MQAWQHNLANAGLSAAVFRLQPECWYRRLACDCCLQSHAVLRRAWGNASRTAEHSLSHHRLRSSSANSGSIARSTPRRTATGDQSVSRTSSKDSRLLMSECLNSGPVLTRAALIVALDSVSLLAGNTRLGAGVLRLAPCPPEVAPPALGESCTASAGRTCAEAWRSPPSRPRSCRRRDAPSTAPRSRRGDHRTASACSRPRRPPRRGRARRRT